MNGCTHIRILDMHVWTHRGHEDVSCIYTAPALTRRHDEIFDGIALDEVAQIFIRTLDDISVQRSTLSTPVMVVVCSVLVRTVYTAPGNASPMVEPLSTVPLCIHSGVIPVSLCLQMRMSWSEQSPPWSSRETLKVAVRCRAKKSICERCTSVNVAKYVCIYSTVYIGIAKTACAILLEH